MAQEKPRWKFEVTENGQWVAGGDCPNRDTALANARHYTMMFGQDGGDVRAIVWTGRKPRKQAAETAQQQQGEG